jgi:hypothetical protein
MTAIDKDIILAGGFYFGQTHLIFLKEHKYNRTFQFPTSTITALGYHPAYRHLFIGDS